jgi:malto-oligosyltrehalose trehalohydrolase
MPVADFPGARDWGYDGVLPFAPDRHYGTPEDLKALIEAAHHRSLMVLLDVVYNHFGPEGNYLHVYAPQFFTEHHHTPWGAAINFDSEGSRVVRDFFIHNALYWLEEFHFDGLRFDAVHAVRDDSRPDIMQELGREVRRRWPGRDVHLVLENDGNAAHYLRPGEGDFDAQWNDDFHHCLHVITTGEESGYYADFAQQPHALLARSLSEGFAFQGEHSGYRQQPRGEPSRDLAVTAFVNFLQNHDQVGNRAFGERLSRLTSPEALRAATAILLLAPAPPLLFMGQEWRSARPFPFFCDFGVELAPSVTEGRRREFAGFTAFADAAQRARIPDPQAPTTAASAILQPGDGHESEASEWYQLHRTLLQLRHREIVPRLQRVTGNDAHALVVAENVIVARWRLADGTRLWLLANLGADPVSDIRGPSEHLVYGTPRAFTENGTLAGWGVAWYLTTGSGGHISLNDEPVLE